jgi:phosphoribosylamine-glycine ligase
MGARIYYASINKEGEEELRTTSSRSLLVLGEENDIPGAREKAYEVVGYLAGLNPLLHWRSDIAADKYVRP